MLLRALALLSLLLIPLTLAGPFHAGEYTAYCPLTHDNLTIWLITGPDRAPGQKYLTLEEAMDQKKVVVHETANVNELAIENLSDEDVFVQCGDIVKGGQQDRTLATDMVLTKAMGKVPIASFCVEHGRWTPRGQEAGNLFGGGSKDAVCGARMKLAGNSNYHGNDQGMVWQSVAEVQQKLSENAGKNVAPSTSPSSLQLTLEQEDVEKQRAAYLKAFDKALDQPGENVIGYVYAINGKVVAGDVYASSALFARMWPKMLRSICTEAFSEKQKDLKFSEASHEAVASCLSDAAEAKKTENKINDRAKVIVNDTPTVVMFETRDAALKDQWIHRGYISKPPTTQPAQQEGGQRQQSR